MKTYLSAKELYGMFLQSFFWMDLSRLKRRMVGRCERCGSRKRLQAHHVRYPEHWFDTRLADLRVLCRGCHEAEHGLNGAVVIPDDKDIPESAFADKRAFSSLLELLDARSQKRISRELFLKERERLMGVCSPNKNRSAGKRWKKKKRRAPSWKQKHGKHKHKASRPFSFRCTRAKHWVQRGNSSN